MTPSKRPTPSARRARLESATADALLEAHAKARELAEDAIEEQRQEERAWPKRR